MRAMVVRERIVTILSKAEKKYLSTALVIQHLTFPFQMWFVNALIMLQNVTAFAAIIVSFSIAASTTTSESSPRALGTKVTLIGAVVIGTFIFFPSDWSLMGLVIEATLAGIFQARMLEWSLAAQSRVAGGKTGRTKLLSVLVAGHLAMPRLLHLVGLPTHISQGLAADGDLHINIVVLNALINEALLLARPATFTRLRYTTTAEAGLFFSKKHDAALSVTIPCSTPTAGKITGLHQFAVFVAVRVVWWGLNDAVRPWATLKKYGALYLRALNSVQRGHRRLSQAMRLFLLGRRSGFEKLLGETWAQADTDSVVNGIIDIFAYINFWMIVLWMLYLVWHRFIR